MKAIVKKPILACDIDEVLANWLGGFIPWHNQQFQTSINLTQVNSHNISQVLGCDDEETADRVMHFCSLSDFDNIEPVIGSKEAVSYLAEKFNIILITARSSSLDKQTYNWVNKHFSGQITDIYHSAHLYTQRWSGKTKEKICQEIGAIAMVEDSYQHATLIAQNGTTTFLLDYPWNNGEEHQNIVRVKNWQEIVKSFK